MVLSPIWDHYKIDHITDWTKYPIFSAIANKANSWTLGVRVIPELPQPGNAGNGWQFPGGENLTVCRNMEPWHKYCEEPPCGQVRRTATICHRLSIHMSRHLLSKARGLHIQISHPTLYVDYPWWNRLGSVLFVPWRTGLALLKPHTGLVEWSEYATLML